MAKPVKNLFNPNLLAINNQVYALFHLTPAEKQTLHDHMEKAMIDYPLREV